MELIEVATDSTGRANEQFAKYADTIEYKVNKIKNSWEELRVTLMSKGTFNWFLDMADSALQKMKTMDVKDFGILTVWALTVGKSIVNGLIEGISNSGNKIRETIAKVITGQKYTVELQTKIDQSFSDYRKLRKGLVPIKDDKDTAVNASKQAQIGVQNSNNAWAALTYGTNGETIRQINQLYEERKLIYQELYEESLKEESSEERLAQIQARLVENERNYNTEVNKTNPEIQQVANKRINQLDTERQITLEAERQNQKYQQQEAEIKQIQQYRLAKLGQSFGTAMGQAATTAISMALTGSFKATEIAATTMTTSLTGVVSALTTGNWQLALAQGAMAALSFGAKKWFEYVEKTNEEIRLANDEVYRYKKQLEDLEKTQETYNQKLDEANSKYNEAKGQWDNINKAAKTYEELSNKSLLDEEEQQQLVDSTQTLAELIPELVVGYDDQANAIIDTSSNYDKLIEQYRKAEENAKALQKQAEATAEALGLVQNYLENKQTLAMARDRATLAEETRQRKFYNSGFDWIATGNEFHTYDYYAAQSDFNSATFYDDPKYWVKAMWNDPTTSTAWRQLFVDVLQDTSGVKNAQSLSANSKTDDIIDAFDDNDYIWQEFIEKFDEKLRNSKEDVEKLEKEAEATKAELKSKIPTLRQSVIEGIIADLSAQGWDDAKLAQYKDFLNFSMTTEQLEQFIDDAIDQGASTNGDVISRGIQNYLETFSISEDDLSKFKNLTEEQLETLSNFVADIQNLSVTEMKEKYNELIASKDLDINTKNAIDDFYYSKIEQIQESLQASAEEVANSLGTSGRNYEQIYDDFSKIGEETTNAILRAITDKVDDADARAALTDSALTLIEEGIDASAISTAINSVDWSSITIFNEEDILTILKGSLANFNLTDGQIQEIYDILASYFVNREMTSVDYSAMTDEVITKYDKFTKKGTALTEYFEENRTAIALEGKELKQVQKALEDTGASADAFLDTTNGGTIFNVQAAKEWYEAQTNNSKKLEERIKTEKQLGNLSEDEIKDLEEELKTLRQEETVVRSILGLEQSIDTVLSKRVGKISSSISAYKSMMSNFYSNGTIDSSSFSSWAQAMVDLDPSINLKQFFDDTTFNTSAYETYINQQISELENLKNLNAAQKEDLIKLKELRWNLQEVNTELEKEALSDNEIVKAQKAVEDAHKKVVSALDDIAKAEQNVIDKQNELNEAMYGSNNFKNQLDSMYNYSTLNQKYADAAARAKDILDSPEAEENTKAALQDYLSNTRNQLLNYLAQNRVYAAAAQSDLASLYEGLPSRLQGLNEKFGANYDTNVRQYFKIIDGVLTADIDALNRAALPDEIKNEIATLAESYNTNTDNVSKNNDAIRKLLKERQEIHKANLQAEVTIQEKVAEVLKEKYEEQVEDLKDKYDAMKEADNEYLEALQDSIDKQRKLREQENKWEDLAQKRKKLSLQQRDTSGANILENQKLEKEIQKDEQSLLDSSIDNIVNDLKEFYELQDETRQEEIEYQEALKDNTNWIAEANKIVLGLGTAEDFINWMKENSDDWKDKTSQQIELEKIELTEIFQKHQEYMEEQEEQIVDSLHVTEEEIQRVINDTSEALIGESERSLSEITEKVDDSIESAKTALTDAMTALSEKQEAYLTALGDEQTKVGELKAAYDAADKAAQYLRDTLATMSAEYEAYLARIEEEKAIKKAQEDAEKQRSLVEAGIYGYVSMEDKTGTDVNNIADYERQKGIEAEKRKEEERQRNSQKLSIEEAQDKLSIDLMSLRISSLSDLETPYELSIKDYSPLSKEDIVGHLKNSNYHGYYNNEKIYLWGDEIFNRQQSQFGYKAFATGGLVNYTGPAWVDGTPTRPEAFLSADDTENIAAMTNVLASLRDLLDFTTYSQSPAINNTNNDTTINVTVNVENIADDYDVDSAVERIKQDIVDAASYAGSNVILNI